MKKLLIILCFLCLSFSCYCSSCYSQICNDNNCIKIANNDRIDRIGDEQFFIVATEYTK